MDISLLLLNIGLIVPSYISGLDISLLLLNIGLIVPSYISGLDISLLLLNDGGETFLEEHLWFSNYEFVIYDKNVSHHTPTVNIRWKKCNRKQ